MVPSGLRRLLTTGLGPDDGGSNQTQLRPHMADKSEMEVVSAAITGQTNVAAEMKPATARWKYFLAMSRLARSLSAAM